MFETNLKAGEIRKFNSSSHTVCLHGLPVNGKSLSDGVNMLDVPQDETTIHINFAYNGTSRTEVSIHQPYTFERSIEVYGAGGYHETQTNSSTSHQVPGEVVVEYQTNCGDPKRDVFVSIRIKPDHAKEQGELTYSVRKAQ